MHFVATNHPSETCARRHRSGWRLLALPLLFVCASVAQPTGATPANRAAFAKFYDRFLLKRLANCTTCHLPATTNVNPVDLKDFPHNPFGNRLRLAAEELKAKGKKTDIVTRLQAVANEDTDGDGVDNLTELLLGHAPGDPKDRPSAAELKTAKTKRAAFAKYLAGYRWQPFDAVRRPAVPKVKDPAFARNPIDAFLAVERDARHLTPRPEASKTVLLRRVTLDLIGLSPTPDELRAFLADTSPNAYEKVVDRLLASPRYGERWGRHWMDVWRYSDWAGWADGGQIRDSKPFIWRWRDWIVESLNKDKGYDRMVQEMLAADELCPEDADALRATGFLVRNFKLLSREQWMEDTVGHTAKAFLGVTMHCAKCHEHMYDPISQKDYYRMRAIFEPHNVRTDRIPGQADTNKDGLVRAYDAEPKAATYLFIRGDERNPDKNQPMQPGVPIAFGGAFQPTSVKLARLAYAPDKRDFVVQETLAAAQKEIEDGKTALAKLRADKAAPAVQTRLAELSLDYAERRYASLQAVLRVETLEDAGKKNSEEWKQAATATVAAQRAGGIAWARLELERAQNAQAEAQSKAGSAAKGKDKAASDKANAELTAAKTKVTEAEKALKDAEATAKSALTTAYKPREMTTYPVESTGRRLAFARWLTDRRNPLVARVAVNHIWARHFGQGIVPSLSDFGRNGRVPSHPQLLDWLAAELMEPILPTPNPLPKGKGLQAGIESPPSALGKGAGGLGNWSMKHIHRLIVTSRAYRMASTPDPANAKSDPDNIYLWRMASRRMEAEVVRDNLLYVSGQLDETMGGADIDHNQGLTSRRRSIYLRHAAEKQAEFLQIFDGPSVTECYERKPSVMPQQALALANSSLAVTEARSLARSLAAKIGKDVAKFTDEAFVQVLARRPTAQERKLCLGFLAEQSERFRRQTTARTASDKPEDVNAPSSNADLRARENLILVLFNHNDFVTVR